MSQKVFVNVGGALLDTELSKAVLKKRGLEDRKVLDPETHRECLREDIAAKLSSTTETDGLGEMSPASTEDK